MKDSVWLVHTGPNSPYNSSFRYLVPCSNCFHFLAHPHLQRSSQQTFRFMPLFASSPWTPTESCYTFVMWVPNAGRVPDTNTSQFRSAGSFDFRESRVPARGFQCGAYTTAHLTVPSPKYSLTWERDLGTEAITITSGNPQLLLTWGTSKARNQGFWAPEKCPPQLAQLRPNPD